MLLIQFNEVGMSLLSRMFLPFSKVLWFTPFLGWRGTSLALRQLVNDMSTLTAL